MLIPFRTQPVETASTPRETKDMLQKIISGDLPACAIRRPDVSFDRAWNGLGRMAMAAGFAPHYRHGGLSLMRNTAADDMPVHLECPPRPEANGIVWLHAHQVLEGACRTLFFEITEQYQTAGFLHGSHTNLPDNTDEALNVGFIDPTVLQPDAYIHENEPGDILLFQASGPWPLAHKFSTTQFPRTSRIELYMMP